MTPTTVLERLQLTHFRNLLTQTLEFGPGVHFIAGANGAGKTNLLDAIYYLCLTRSHFSYGDAASIATGENWLRLAGVFALGGKTERVALKLQPRKGKTVERAGVPYGSLVEHVGLLPAVMISPADVELATGSPEERRRFLDQTIAQYDPGYLSALVTYNRLLKLRGALLKDASHPLEVDLTLLGTYDRQLAKPAQRIFETRSSFVEQLRPLFQELYTAISGGSERASMYYGSKLAERPYNELLQRARDQDLLLRRTNVGPHRDELELQLDDRPLRRFASQGQLKSFVLAMRLGQSRILQAQQGKAPLLLLDDLFDRLDARRVQQLLDLILHERYGQVFVTDTHPTRLAALRTGERTAHYFEVQNGSVSRLPVGRDFAV